MIKSKSRKAKHKKNNEHANNKLINLSIGYNIGRRVENEKYIVFIILI